MASAPVLVTRRLPEEAIARLTASCEVTLWQEERPMPRARLLADSAGKAAIITLLSDRVDDELLEAAGAGLRIVANYAVGVDNVDLAACSRRAVMVANTPDVLTEATADMAWALVMAAARRVAEGDRVLRAGSAWVWGPEMMLGREVYGKTLGIVGFGRIGRAVARRAGGFGMRVLAAERSGGAAGAGGAAGTGGAAGAGGAGGEVEWLPLDDLLAASDFVSLHVNLSDETRHLLDRERLARMRPTAVLVNTSRGPVVDEAALAEALSAGRLFAAGLDVFEAEPHVHPDLLSHPRVVLTPHLGSATVDTRRAMGILAVDNVLEALAGRRPPALVNEDAFRRPKA